MALTDTIALTTLSNVKGDLGITASTYDTVLERMILAASEAIGRYCGRDFRKTSTSETLAGSGTRRLLLKRTPLVSITSVVDDGTTLDSTAYSIEDADAGILYGDAVWRPHDLTIRESIGRNPIPGTGERTIVVTYIGGYVLPNDATGTRSLPYDLEEAAILTAVALWRSRGRDRTVTQESLGDAAVAYGGSADPSAASIIPAEARAALNQYRRLEFAS